LLDQELLKKKLSPGLWSHVPKGADESPYLTDESDKNSNTGCFLRMAINRVSNKYRCRNLVSSTRKRNTYHWGDVPMTLRSELYLDKENHYTRKCEHKP
jgi:hypothetical protein